METEAVLSYARELLEPAFTSGDLMRVIFILMLLALCPASPASSQVPSGPRFPIIADVPLESVGVLDDKPDGALRDRLYENAALEFSAVFPAATVGSGVGLLAGGLAGAAVEKVTGCCSGAEDQVSTSVAAGAMIGATLASAAFAKLAVSDEPISRPFSRLLGGALGGVVLGAAGAFVGGAVGGGYGMAVGFSLGQGTAVALSAMAESN